MKLKKIDITKKIKPGDRDILLKGVELGDNLYVTVNCIGGEVAEAIRIAHIMSCVNTHVHVIHRCDSAAIFLLLDMKKRTCTKYARFLFHMPRNMSDRTINMESAKANAKLIAQYSKLSEEECLNLFKKNIVLLPNQMIRIGLIDEVID